MRLVQDSPTVNASSPSGSAARQRLATRLTSTICCPGDHEIPDVLRPLPRRRGMSDIAESAIQAALVDRLTKPDLGWRFVAGGALDRTADAVLIESEVVAALRRLNPAIAEKPERVDEVLPRLRATILAVRDDGLVESNRRMTSWLRGQETIRFVGTDDYVPIRLIDFDNPRANSLDRLDRGHLPPGHRGAPVRPRAVGQRLPAGRGRNQDPREPHDLVAQRRRGHPRRLRGQDPRLLRAQRALVRHRGQGVPLRGHPPARRDVAAVVAHDRRVAAPRARVRPALGRVAAPARDAARHHPDVHAVLPAVLGGGWLHDQDHPALPAGRGGRGHRGPGPRPPSAAGARLASPRQRQDAPDGVRRRSAAPASPTSTPRPSSSCSTDWT